MATEVTENVERTLAKDSPKDKRWDKKKKENVLVREIFQSVEAHAKKALRMTECARMLIFEDAKNIETGEITKRLHRARFCRVRNCPICQERKAMAWTARFFKALPDIANEYPKARYMFLTLTVKNCDVSNLRETLKDMNKGWGRFIKLKTFNGVLGWTRSTEVKFSKASIQDNTVSNSHPHFHVLLMVEPSKLTGHNYVKHFEWVAAWRKAMRLDYDPSIDVRVVKARKGEVVQEGVLPAKAILETFKYAVKPDEMINNKEWFLELANQIHQLHFFALGGVFKEFLSREKLEGDGEEQEIDEDEMMLKDGSTTRVGNLQHYYQWKDPKRKYFHYKTIKERSVDELAEDDDIVVSARNRQKIVNLMRNDGMAEPKMKKEVDQKKPSTQLVQASLF